MIIVSDTTPIHYLIQIGKIDILRDLFAKIIIPQAVFDELQREKTPQEIKDWMNPRPFWLEVRHITEPVISTQKKLGDGEREAITLAWNFMQMLF